MFNDHIKEETFRTYFSISDYLQACDAAFRLYGKGIITNPPKKQSLTKIHNLDLFRLEMPAYWPGKYGMRKIIEETSDLSSGKLGSRKAFICLHDVTKNSNVKIDANHLTDMRTGAAAALGIKYICKRTIKRASIIGTGRVARTSVMAVDSLFQPDEIMVFSRKKHRAESFVQLMANRVKSRLHPAETVADCVKNTDAILTAVPAKAPVLSLSLVNDHTPISVVAGDPRSRQISSDILESKQVIVDDLKQAYVSGEFLYARASKRLEKIQLFRRERDQLVTVKDAACGRLPSHHNIALVYFTGLAVLDLLAAVMIYKSLEVGSKFTQLFQEET